MNIKLFTEKEIDVAVIGIHRVKKARDRCKASYKSKGISGLDDTRKGNSGQQSDK